MKKDRPPMDCHRALKTARILLGASFVFFLIALIPGLRSIAFLPWLILLTGVGLFISGLVCGLMYCVCPYCCESLMHGPKLPPEIPTFCPHCGRKL